MSPPTVFPPRLRPWANPRFLLLNFLKESQIPHYPTLLQDLTQDSATLTGWRRTKRSEEGKMIALNGPGISSLTDRSFPAFFRYPEFFRDFHGHQSGKSLAHAGILHSSRNVKYQYGHWTSFKMFQNQRGRNVKYQYGHWTSFKMFQNQRGAFCIPRKAIFQRRASFWVAFLTEQCITFALAAIISPIGLIFVLQTRGIHLKIKAFGR